MRLYIAGPMTGYPEHNFPHFLDVAARLRAAGYMVACPAEGIDPADLKTAIAEDDHQDGALYKSFMRRDIKMVMESDGLCLLTGWQHSKGAATEKHVADTLGLPCHNVDRWLDHPPVMLKWTGEDEMGPVEKKYIGDAGYDLRVAKPVRIPVGGFLDVPLGCAVQLPPGVWAMLTGRSSTIRVRGLLVTQGIIDNGFTGSLYAGVKNLGESVAELEVGERIAQLIPFRLEPMELVRVTQLESVDGRGGNGFGSTGK